MEDFKHIIGALVSIGIATVGYVVSTRKAKTATAAENARLSEKVRRMEQDELPRVDRQLARLDERIQSSSKDLVRRMERIEDGIRESMSKHDRFQTEVLSLMKTLVKRGDDDA